MIRSKADDGHRIINIKLNTWDARINGTARRNQNNREEPPRQRTREGLSIFYSSGRICHVQQNFNQKSTRYQFRISGGISQTIDDTKKAEVILNAPVIVSHNEGMKALHRVTQPTNR